MGTLKLDITKTIGDSPIKKHVKEFGYETEWLRKEPFVTLIRDKRWNLEMEDPFGDKYNYRQVITLNDGYTITIFNKNEMRLKNPDGSINKTIDNEKDMLSYIASKRKNK